MRAELFGFKIDTYTFEEALVNAETLLREDKVSQVITINPEMLETVTGKSPDLEFGTILQEAELVVPDGVGVKIALKLNGVNVERIPGIDFAYRLLEYSAENSIPVAIIGAKEEILVKALENLKLKIPKLNIVYSSNGYFDNDDHIYSEIKEKNPKLILVAMGSPRQEKFIYRAKTYLNPCLMIGIGGSLDVWSGNVKRAPAVFQKTGTEWLYRTVTQPERIRRIFPTLPLFLIKSVRYKLFK